jgi:hypothetical protein
MKTLRLAVLVGVASLGYAAPSSALPSINLVKTSSSTGRLDVITSNPGVLGVELSIVFGQLKFTSVTINSAIFGVEKPGDNPFLQGSPEGGDTIGLWLRDDQQALFASFESLQVQPGVYQLLQFEYEAVLSPMCGYVSADGFVSVNGVTTNVPSSGGGVVCETPTGDTNGDGITNLDDLNNVKNNFGSPSPPSLGDADFDGDIDLADLNIVKNNFGASPSVSVPEPSSLAIVTGMVLSVVAARRSSNP